VYNTQHQLELIRGIHPNAYAPQGTSITELSAGGYIEFGGAYYHLVTVSRYLDVKWNNFKKRKNDYWVYELQLVDLMTSEVRWIEWEYDDELEITETLARIALREISHKGQTITLSALAEIAENESGQVTYQGKTYDYVEDDAWAALYYKTEESEPAAVRMFEFTSADNQYLTIEAWDNEDDRPDREAFLSKPLSSSSIQVVQKKPYINKEQ